MVFAKFSSRVYTYNLFIYVDYESEYHTASNFCGQIYS